MLRSALSVAILAAVAALPACHAGASPPPDAPPPAAAPVPSCEWCGLAEAPPDLTATMRLGESTADDSPGEPMRIVGVVRDEAGRALGGVRVYAYHTDPAGRYTPSDAPRGNEARHGRLRGWLETGADGRYRIETTRPGPYPGRPDPEHIHLAMARPGDTERYAGEIVFADDPRLTGAWQTAQRRTGNPFTVCAPTRAADGVWNVPCNLDAPGRDALRR